MTEHDPVIVALLKRLPEAGTFWPAELRRRWLDAMESTIDLVYLDEPTPIFIQREITEEQRQALRNVKPGKIVAIDRPEPNAIQEVLTDTHVLAVAVHVPEEQLQHTITVDEMPSQTHQPEPQKNLGGRPSQVGRPEDIPSNRDMAVAAIKELGPASATQIREYVRKHYWSGAPAHWTATLYDMVNVGKLKRQGINFVLPEPSTAVAKPAAMILKPAPKKVQLQPRTYAPHENPEEFQWKDSAAVFLSPKEYLLAAKLRAAMGKGHIGVQYLAENALGMRRGQGEEAKLTLRNLATAMGDRLASIGLAIEYHEGFGFLMKEVDVG